MLRITVELIPLGNEKLKRPLSIIDVKNTGQVAGDTTASVYYYSGWFLPTGTENKAEVSGVVGYALRRSFFPLIKTIVDEIIGFHGG
jgi:hypothetical protein